MGDTDLHLEEFALRGPGGSIPVVSRSIHGDLGGRVDGESRRRGMGRGAK